MKHLTIAAIIALVAGTCFTKDEGPAVMLGSAGYDFITADNSACEVVKYSGKGERTWIYPGVKAIDVWPLPKDEVLIAYLPSDKTSGKGGVRIVDKDKKIVMDHQVDDEVMSCMVLPNGNILFTENKAGKLTELDRKGRVIRSFDVKAKGMGHKTVRFIRLTSENTILAAECYSHVVREYSIEGRLIREFKHKMSFSAYRLANGNTLISGYTPPHIVELNPKGDVVWELSAKDLPGDMGFAHFCEVNRLPNGNTLVAARLRKTQENKTVVFEITPDKKLVWQLRDSTRLKGLLAVKPIWKK